MTAPDVAASKPESAPPPLAPDPAAAGEFLDQWVELTGVPHVTLVRITPDHPDPRTAAKGRAFRWAADRDAALRWIVANNANSNIYFSVNTARPVHKKPLKKDVEALNAVHADVDPRTTVDPRATKYPREERRRLINLAAELAGRERPPSFVLDSGGGIQAFYVATESCPADPVEYVHEVESYSGRLHCVLGVDPCTRNVDRVMRVPGTVNWPDWRKRSVGRVPAVASMLHASGRTYHWHEIADEIAVLEDEPPEHSAEPFVPRTRFGDHSGGNGAVLEGMPPYPTDDQLKALLENHPEVCAIWDQSTSWPPLDPGPSGWDFRLASELSFLGFEPDLIGSFLRAYRAHHAPEKGKQNREDYIMRTVERATARHREEDEPEDDGPPFEAKPNGAGQQQTAGDAKGKNRGTFHTGAKPGADWPEPGVLGAPPPAPRFPTEHLPGMLRQWIERQAASMALPPEILAIPALVCIGGAIGKDAIIMPKAHDPSWTERPCLWGPIIMDKGQGKSPALKEAAAPLDRAEARARDAWKVKHDEWKRRQPARKKAAKELGVGAPPDDPEPLQPKLILDDTSIEAAAQAMVESRGLTLVKDELSSWIFNMSRYNKGNDRGFWLTCHSGGVGRVDRIMRGRQIIPDMFCGITGGIQPPVARRAIAPALEHLDDGFFERFGLLAFPDPVPWPGIIDAPPERDYRRMVAEAVDRLANTEFSREQPLRFDAAAQAMWNEWYDHHMHTRVRGAAAAEQPTHGFMTKAAGLVLRLCIVFHWFRWTFADGVFEHNSRAADARTLGAAIGIFEQFCIPTYERVIAAFGKVESHEAARRVLDLIKRKKLARIRVGDVTKMHWSGLTERKPILAAFEALEDIDVLRPVASPRGTRAPTHWLVNPKL
jgi:Protein of unknown function (DUF3987)